MKIIREKSVYQLAFMPNLFPVNCYLVEESDGLTLIDAALPFSKKAILKAAQQIGKPITKILLTHAHGDHVGALDELKNSLPDVPVFISKRDSRLLAGDVSLDPDEPTIPIRGGVPKNIKTKPDVLLNDGDRIGSLVAITTPGHTPGSMSFFDTRSKVIIAGDAFQTKGGFAVSGQLQPFFPFPAMATWNKELALASAKKIKELNPSILAIGHGNMIHLTGKEMDTVINKAEANIGRK
ncbi:MBL fold metallo-hydrolase [Bacillus luteolus]|uniref:MBL fold metallo-hydrolase n=1 Tax=Litchfieldia luteola TaxID=682179 RepID=A0ABR9QH62_9BACI|nr:MBL fold metallo-hydrolase [Cytobacillus luteolus]MBE4907813.1 MBL fold metallo-hydrolase [Cytobacillus luteolus]MBP1944030.1 glyoxylase-like metal-dependent hydrolase (beta-lactamase superfamily II) [Cytobacillus luteolus]